MSRGKPILVYDLKSLPEDLRETLTLDEFIQATIESGVCVWDSSLKGKSPYVLGGITKMKIKDIVKKNGS